MRGFVTVLLFTALLSGCAHVISDESRNLVDPSIPFSRLRAAPESYRGKYVMVGGMIASLKNDKDSSKLLVVQSALDSFGVPGDADASSEGRFMAVSRNFLDPMIFKPGRKVTVVGQVEGQEVLPLGDIKYVYPVLQIREIYLVPKAEPRPAYYPPYGYYDPFWWGPPYWRYRYYYPWW
ncbi:MAG: Slp/YeaY family lipoprotein [Geobacteraceae bacterium]|nr:Slp/YeaY family lipoprotein [Geobacteraceae bacterium]